MPQSAYQEQQHREAHTIEPGRHTMSGPNIGVSSLNDSANFEDGRATDMGQVGVQVDLKKRKRVCIKHIVKISS